MNALKITVLALTLIGSLGVACARLRVIQAAPGPRPAPVGKCLGLCRLAPLGITKDAPTGTVAHRCASEQTPWPAGLKLPAWDEDNTFVSNRSAPQ
jgi:hypothetical protein